MTAAAIMTCPSDETLASFADHRLDGEERQRVVEHISTCGDCRSIVLMASDFQVASGGGTVTRFAPRAAIAGVALAAAIVLAVVALPEIREWIAWNRLIAAYERTDKREIEVRFTGLPHKEFKPATRGENDRGGFDHQKLGLEVARGELEESAKDGAWRELRVLAAAQLLTGQRKEAVATLERAIAQEGGENPELISDLAAAQVELARYGQPKDVKLALERAERAWQLQKTRENAWNRALAYEYNHRDDDARRAWQDYWKLDPSSPWADEARAKLVNTDDPP